MQEKDVIMEALLSSNDEKNIIHNALIRFLESDFFFGPHCHQNVELCLMLKGECDIIVNGEVVTVHENEFMVLFPNCIHSFRVKHDKTANFLQMHFRSESFLNMDPKTYKQVKFLFYMATESKAYMKAKYSDEIFSCVKRIVYEINEDKQINNIALANLYIYELILLLSRDIQNSFNSVLKVDHPITAAAVEYINNNIEAKISLSDVAKNCNVSKRNLTEIFKKHINVTVNEYINITKIKKAIEYIYDSDESLTDIAYRLNFGSVQYFSAVFKKYAGVAPREFKNLNSRQV